MANTLDQTSLGYNVSGLATNTVDGVAILSRTALKALALNGRSYFRAESTAGFCTGCRMEWCVAARARGVFRPLLNGAVRGWA
jgi:hypothetical protein